MSRRMNPYQLQALQMLSAQAAVLGLSGDDVLGDDFDIGEDEIIGDDLDDAMGDDAILGAVLGYDVLGADILGAVSPAASRKKMLARAVAAKHARVLAKRSPSGAQEQVLGFERASVTALSEGTVRAFPQRKFRTERFTVAASIANFFDILDLRVGRDSLFVDVGPVPAEMFSQVGVGTALRGYTANLGNTITLQVENVDSNDQFIRAGIVGTAITY